MAVLASIPIDVKSVPAGLLFALDDGIPFKRSILNDKQYLRLLENGVQATAQFETLGQWPDGSQASVLVAANFEPSRTYVLQIMDEIEAIPTPNVAAPAMVGDLYIVIGGVTYFAVTYDTTKVTTTEVQGPFRSITLITGKFTSSASVQALSGGLEYVIRITAYKDQSYKTYEFTLIDGRDQTIAGDNTITPAALSATEYGYTRPFAGTQYFFGGPVGQVLEHSGVISGTVNLYQTGQLVFSGTSLLKKNQSYTATGGVTGARAQGWMTSYNGVDSACTIIMQDFWQQLPKRLDATTTTLGVRFHPVQYTTESDDPQDTMHRNRNLYGGQTGFAKTYRILVDEGPFDIARIRKLVQAYQGTARIQASTAAWYCESRVFGDLKPASATAGVGSFGYDKTLIENTYDPSVQQAYDNPTNSQFTMPFHWRDFGDPMRANSGLTFYNDTHNGAHQFFIEYLRNIGINPAYEEKYYWWWLKKTQHWYDIDVVHARRQGKWTGGFANGRGEFHANGHDTGDHHTVNGHLSHAHISGLVGAILVKGDRRAMDVHSEVRSWWTAFIPNRFPPTATYGDQNPHQAEEHRTFGWPMIACIQSYMITRNQADLNNAVKILNHCLNWWKTPPTAVVTAFGETKPYNHHWQHGVDLGAFNYQAGTGFMYCYMAQDNRVNADFPNGVRPFISNGASPWMLFPLLAGMIQCLILDEYGLITNRNEVWDCILQHINYCFKYVYDANTKSFGYAEDYPYGTGRPWGPPYGDVPFARLCAAFVISSAVKYLATATTAEVPNIGWYDTRGNWQVYLDAYFNSWKNHPLSFGYMDFTSQGFYGYEEAQPADQWEMDDKQRFPITAVSYGEKVPLFGESPAGWTGWINALGAAVAVSGDPIYGSVTLDDDGIAVSPVRNLGATGQMRTITLARGRYRGGQGLVEIWVRGQDTPFTSTALTPDWERYILPIQRQWAYVQIKIQKRWVLTFADEFNGAAGTQPNPSFWKSVTAPNFEDSSGLGVNYYIDTNTVLDGNGSLGITVKQQTIVTGGHTYTITSGRVLNKIDVLEDLFSQTYGRFEGRIKFAYGNPGLSPSWWLFATQWNQNPPPGKDWAECGEIDIFENYQQAAAQARQSVIYQGSVGSASFISNSYNLPNGGLINTAFHVYGFEWTKNQMRWYLDGRETQRVNKSQIPMWVGVYDQPFGMVMQLAAGNGPAGGTPSPGILPQTSLYDYVRVYAQQG